MKKILISSPSKGSVHDAFYVSMINFSHVNSPKYEMFIGIQRGVYIHECRNRAFLDAQDRNMDYLLICDTDIAEMPLDCLDRMIALDKDIVTTLCYHKVPPYNAHVFFSSPDRPGYFNSPVEINTNEPFQCDAAGVDFVLIRKNVLDDFKVRRLDMVSLNPYQWIELAPPYRVRPFNHIITSEGESLGEDLSFYTRTKAYGFELWVIPDLTITHFGEMGYKRNLNLVVKEDKNGSEVFDNSLE